ncbi:molybdopterin synthase catalytic subunit [Williamsia maris]|uniref:Molybdopterin synthase catalytic subunit n=1 Tax=Williamsia maris TaxID=72806 RepID=A0ABT1HJG8_9NOCA|nr:molybdenum cofactor biosynthesis protein MoaE [Williamsia maris]MCP2178064.1 molybdopterin synthase catalytic subunit [Williamsia maris]
MSNNSRGAESDGDVMIGQRAVVSASVLGEPLSGVDVTAHVASPGCGAVVTFSGTVRDHSYDHHGALIDGVTAIDYEVYERHAVDRMEQIAHAAAHRWTDVGGIAIVHRRGVVPTGEASVLVAVAAGHRAAAFHAAQFCIDVLKLAVPIWKRELHRGGGSWVETGAAIDDVAVAANAWRPVPVTAGA